MKRNIMHTHHKFNDFIIITKIINATLHGNSKMIIKEQHVYGKLW